MISKKLLSSSSIILILTLLSQISGNYLINYPMKFYWSNILENTGWTTLFIILGLIALVSWLISNLTIRNINPVNKFLLVFSIICGLFLCFINLYSLNIFFKTKKEIAIVKERYSQQVKKDIKNDRIVFQYAGGLAIPEYDERTYQKIDSIRKNYGFEIKNTGCQVDFIEIEGQQKYEEIANVYLDKRNGKGWKKRMDNEITLLKKVELHPDRNN